MTARLLVGAAEAAEVTEPRRWLLDLLEGLSAFDVEIKVALFGDGPLRPELERVADVRVFRALPPRSPAGLVQSLARRASPSLEGRVHDLRTADDLRWIGEPDGVHLHGPLAATLLRYVRSPDVPVTTYAHQWDFSIAGLSPLDRDRLVRRTTRFFAADESVTSDLVAAGVDRGRISLPPDHVEFPPAPPDPSVRERARSELGVPADATVVGVPPVADWVDCPDLTLTLAWELERLGGAGAPTVVWCGMPESGDRRWPVDFDIERMGLKSVRLVSRSVPWEELLAVADVVVLPILGTEPVPEGAAEAAATTATPLLCWEGHADAGEVALWRGSVVDRGDVPGMAARVWEMVRDGESLRRARSVSWRPLFADVESILPIEVPVP